MRVSSYNIYVMLPIREKILLIQGYTGAIDFVDIPLGKKLQALFVEKKTDCELSLAPALVKHLQIRGYLTSKTEQEEVELICKMSKVIHEKNKNNRTKFFIIPSYNCQLRCTYCFERETQNRGKKERWLGKTMTTETVDAFFGAIQNLQTEPTRNPITLYGGEPFTIANHKIVSYILERGHKLGYRFVAITNAVDLDVYRDVLIPELIEGLLVTVDGLGQTHDKTRVYANGKGTFNKVIRNIRMALDRGLKIRVRINTNSDVIRLLPEFAEFIQNEGWDKNSHITVYSQVVWIPEPDPIKKVIGPYTEISSVILKTQATEYSEAVTSKIKSVKLADVIQYLKENNLHKTISAGEPIRYKLETLNKDNPLAAIDPTNCGAHKDMYLFDPLGNIYVCTEHVGIEEHRVGFYLPELHMLSKQMDKWRNRAIHNLPLCQICRYAFFCGGGCAYHTEVEQGDMYKPNCDRFDEQFESIAQEYFDQCELKIGNTEFAETCD